MKRCLLLYLAFTLSLLNVLGTTYYWVGGASASNATAANWNTTLGGGGAERTTPATDDILIFDGNNVGSGVSATTVTVSVTAGQTIGALTVQNNNLTVSFTNPGTTITLTLGGTSNVLNIAAGCTFDVGSNVLLIPNAASFTQSATLTAGSTTATLASTNANIQVGQIVCCPGYLGYQTVTSVSGTTLTLSSANNVLTSGSSSLIFYPTTLITGTGTFKIRNSSPSPLTDCYWPLTVEYCGTVTQYVQRGMYTNLTFSGNRGGAGFALTSGIINIANTLSTSGLSNYIWTATAGTVNFVGTTNQSVPSFTYFSLYNSVYKDNTLSAAGDITVNGSLALTANTIFSDAGYTITVPGNVTGAGTHYSPNPSGAGKISMTSSGNSFSALTSLGNFEISGGASGSPINGPHTASASLQAGCTFTVTSSGFFSDNHRAIFSLGAACAFVVNGGISTSLGGGIYGSSGFVNSTNSPTLTLGSASTVLYNATWAQTITAINYANLSITGARTNTNVSFPSSGTVGISGTLDLTGLSFTSGTIVTTSSTVDFNKITGGQTIPSLVGANYNNLMMSNTSGTQALSGAVTVNNTLTLTAGGKLSLGANDLTIAAAGAISGASSTSYIVTDGVGQLTKLIAAATNPTKTFEVGDASAYTPVTLAITGTIVGSTGSLQVKTATGDHAQVAITGLDATKSVNRNWTISNPVALTGLSSYSPTFNYAAGDVDAAGSTSNFIVRKSSNPVWTLLTVGTKTATSTQATGITSFGDFIVGEEGPAVVIVTVGSYTYNASSQGPTVANNTGTGSSYTYSYVGTGGTSYSASATPPTNVGSYTVTATVAAHGDYAQASSSATPFSIAKATPTLSLSGMQSFTFNEAPQGPATVTYHGDGVVTLLYTSTDGGGYSSTTAPTSGGAYQVIANSTAGANYNAASSLAYSFTIASIVPNPPTSPTAIAGDTQALITVTAPVVNGGSAVLDYTATSSPDGRTGTGTAAGILVTGLNNGTPYTFTVTARNVVGSSTASAASSAVTPTVDLPVTTSQDISNVMYTANSNLTVSSGATLNINQTAAVSSITISAGGKLNLSTHTLTATNVVLKASKTAAPVVSLTTPMVINGTLTFKKTLDRSIWYFISFPSTVTVADIDKHADLGAVNSSNWWIKRYKGDTRATNGGATTNWQNVGDATLTANEGYIIGLANTLVGDYELSFTLANTLLTTPEVQKDLTVGTYVSAINATHSGWNLVGMPYLSQFDANGLGINFVTKFNGFSYDQYAYDDAALDNMNPFESFFVQASGTSLTFADGSRHLVKSLVANKLSDRVQRKPSVKHIPIIKKNPIIQS